MKTNLLKKISLAAAMLACATLSLDAQQRFGGGGGFGGFGGFGGNNGGGNNAARNTSTTAYNNNGAVGSATITVDPETHNLVIIADEATASQIKNVIQNLDAPKRQVLIKVVFLEVQRNDGSDIGVEGGFTKGLGNNLQSSAANAFGLAGANSVVTNFTALGGLLANGSAALSPSSTVGPNGFYQLAGNDFQVTLRAIATAGRAQVLSRPSILARDGQLAKIVVGQSVPLPTSVSYQTSGNTAIPIVNVTYTDVGIILNVTPFIGANNLVEMILQPQISSIDKTQSQAIGNGASAPYLNIRSADTVVVTPDAEPVVIGGLIGNDHTSTDNKVPFLGDIPFIGNLFKTSKKADNKTELLMFLTPHIVDSPAQLSNMSTGERRQTPIITDSVSEKILNQFLERVPVKKK